MNRVARTAARAVCGFCRWRFGQAADLKGAGLRYLLRFVGLAALLGVAGFATTACSSKPAARSEPAVSVQTATVKRGKIQRLVKTEAVLYPVHQADIVPKISAPIRKYYVERGSPVRRGELLVVLENRDLSAAVTEAQGAYQQAQATYVTSLQENLPEMIQTAQLNVQGTQQAMADARLVYRSRERLYKAGALARNLMEQSLVAYVKAQNQYRIAVAHLKRLEDFGKGAQIKSAKAQMTAAEGKYLAAKAQLEYSKIRSPITGVVTRRPLYTGEMANAGSPLITVMDTSQVVARTHISPQQAALLREGDPAFVSLGGSGSGVPGKVTVVSPALDPNSTTVQVWVQAANPRGELKPGSTVDVTMVAKTIPEALWIPASAILTAPDGKRSVMVVGADHVARERAVTLGIHEGDKVQILSGLSEGERVVAKGAFGLPNRTKIQF